MKSQLKICKDVIPKWMHLHAVVLNFIHVPLFQIYRFFCAIPVTFLMMPT